MMANYVALYFIAFLIPTQNNCMEVVTHKKNVKSETGIFSREYELTSSDFNSIIGVSSLILQLITSPDLVNQIDVKKTVIDFEREKYIEKFNNLSLEERSARIKRGAIFNDTPIGLMHPLFAKLESKELDHYFRKINYPNDFK